MKFYSNLLGFFIAEVLFYVKCRKRPDYLELAKDLFALREKID